MWQFIIIGAVLLFGAGGLTTFLFQDKTTLIIGAIFLFLLIRKKNG